MAVHKESPALGNLGIDEAAWWLLAPRTRAIISKACLEKTVWSQKGAMDSARRLRAEGERIAPYRCPFKGDHWHVGHVPSMETVASLALAVRDFHGTAPTTRVDNSGGTP